jgi:hypothetical protein
MKALFTALAVLSASTPAGADVLGNHWEEARVRWNPIGDKAAAGDESALAQLKAAVRLCAPDTECFATRDNILQAERAKLQAAYEACETNPPDAKPGAVLPGGWWDVKRQKMERCRRNLTGLAPEAIDAAAAALNLAWILNAGKLGQADKRQAYEFYAFAAEFKHPIGHYNAGKLLESGDLGEAFVAEGFRHYIRAAALGVTDAWLRLAEMKEQDPGFRPTSLFGNAPQDYENSPRWFYKRARETGPSAKQENIIDTKLAPFEAEDERIREEKRNKMEQAQQCIAIADELQRARNAANAGWESDVVSRYNASCGGTVRLTRDEHFEICMDKPSNLFCKGFHFQ